VLKFFLTRKGLSSFFAFFLVLNLLLFSGCQHGFKKTEPESIPQIKINQIPSRETKSGNNELNLVVFGDNRPASPLLAQPEGFKKILSQIKKIHPDLIVSTGDSVYGSTDSFTYEKQYQEFKSLIKEIKLPFFVAVGNHDALNTSGLQLYRKYLHPQTYFAFKMKGYLFIILDTESQPGRISKEQLEWLEQILKQNSSSSTFVFLHRPPFSLMNPKAEKGKHQSFLNLKNRDQLVSVLKKGGVKAVFAGHEHFFNQKSFQGLNQIISGCAGAPPYTDFAHGGFPHFVLAKIKGNTLTIEVIDENGKSYPPQKFKTPVFP